MPTQRLSVWHPALHHVHTCRAPQQSAHTLADFAQPIDALRDRT